MNFFSYFFLSLNLLWTIYLTYYLYKKNQKTSSSKLDNVASTRQYKINLTRFNPFNDIGGDQSFILCLLDNSSSGVIITSLHTRDSTRVYAKAIKNGQSQETALSKEEAKALIKTINS